MQLQWEALGRGEDGGRDRAGQTGNRRDHEGQKLTQLGATVSMKQFLIILECVKI